jgi:hypothetical protein
MDVIGEVLHSVVIAAPDAGKPRLDIYSRTFMNLI